MTQVAFIKEERHKEIPESLEKLTEFTGIFTKETVVRSSDGSIISSGIHTMISGEEADVVNYFNEISPVWIGVGSPVFEEFKLWTKE